MLVPRKACLVGVNFSDVSLFLQPEPCTKSPIQTTTTTTTKKKKNNAFLSAKASRRSQPGNPRVTGRGKLRVTGGGGAGQDVES